MGITFDGQRSLQRLVSAKKVREVTKSLGLPSATTMRDGFRITINNVDPELINGRITAPAGAAVLCSQASGITLMTADYWAAGFTPKRDVNGFVPDPYPSSDSYLWYLYVGQDAPNRKLVPYDLQLSPDGGVTNYGCTYPAPQLGHFGDEFFRVMVSMTPEWGGSDSLFDGYRNFYLDAGRSLSKYSVSMYGRELAQHEQLLGQRMFGDGFSQITVSRVDRYAKETSGPNADVPIAAFFQVVAPEGVGQVIYHGTIAFFGIPSGMYAHLITIPPDWKCSAVGTYAFSLTPSDQVTVLHAVMAITPYMEANYFAANPSHAPWKLFYSMYTLGSMSIATYSVDTTLLDVLTGGYVIDGAVVDYEKAWQVLVLFFGWPNHRERAAYDSAMFHTHTGEVWSWTRKYGAIRFTTGGMFAASVVLPAVVTDNDGVRPEIYFAGGTNYVCIATKPGYLTDPPESGDTTGVKGVFIGSPYTGWSALPMPDGWRLMHAQIISAGEGRAKLLGVVYNGAACHFAYLSYLDGEGDWRILGRIDVDLADVELAKWSVGLFGNDPLVAEMAAFQSPAPVTSQMSLPPYSVYAGITP